MAAEIGFVLEFFDVVAIGAGAETPIQVTRVIARSVLAVFGEFDGEAVIGAAMEAVQKPSTTTRARSSKLRMAMRALQNQQSQLLPWIGGVVELGCCGPSIITQPSGVSGFFDDFEEAVDYGIGRLCLRLPWRE